MSPHQPRSDSNPTGWRVRGLREPSQGQSVVEFAVLVPVVFIVVLLIVQVVMLATAQLSVVHAAREVARANSRDAAVDPFQIATETSSLNSDMLAVEVVDVVVAGRPAARVTVRFKVDVVVPFVPQESLEVSSVLTAMYEP